MLIRYGIVLGFGEWGSVEQCVSSIKMAGIIPLVILDTAGGVYNTLPREHYMHSTYVNQDHCALVREIKARLEQLSNGAEHEVSVIVNFQDRMWICYLDLREAFRSAVGPDCQMIEVTHIKANCRYLLANTQWAVPYVLLRDDECLRRSLVVSKLSAAFNCEKVVVKPIVGMGSEGVSIIERGYDWDRSVIMTAIEEALDAQTRVYSAKITARLHENNREKCRLNGYVLVEAYLEGTEYSLEGFRTADGRMSAYLEQHKTKTERLPIIRDLGYAFSKSTKRGTAYRFASGIAAACGISGWAFHIEAKGRRRRQLSLIECNPRPGGGIISDLVNMVNGSDLKQLALNTVLKDHQIRGWIAVAVIQPHKKGYLRACHGIDAVKQLPECVSIKQLISDGKPVDLRMEEYIVELSVCGKTKAQAAKRASVLAKKIIIDIE